MNAQMTLTHIANNRMRTIAGIDPRSSRLFDRAYRNPQSNPLQKLFGRKIHPLQCLSHIEAELDLYNRRFDGSQVIAIDQIHGTVNRADDFDYDFRPLKESDEDRWCRVATAMMNGMDLPPIDIVQVGGSYFVKDGHHRVSVARALGYRYLDAIVEVWNDAEPASC